MAILHLFHVFLELRLLLLLWQIRQRSFRWSQCHGNVSSRILPEGKRTKDTASYILKVRLVFHTAFAFSTMLLLPLVWCSQLLCFAVW